MTVLNAVIPNHFSVNWWSNFWHIYIISLFVLSIPICAWFTIGGVMDIKHLFHSLATTVRDSRDDGRVRHTPEPACDPVPDTDAVLEKESPLAL
jgi:hypothetical protein